MEHKQVPCVWRMSYSQQASIVWSGHWCMVERWHLDTGHIGKKYRIMKRTLKQ
jgi:hypothetical protein